MERNYTVFRLMLFKLLQIYMFWMGTNKIIRIIRDTEFIFFKMLGNVLFYLYIFIYSYRKNSLYSYKKESNFISQVNVSFSCSGAYVYII